MNIYFQWVSSDINTISILKSIEFDDGEFYLTFKDGRRCNKKFAKAINENCDDQTCVIQIEDPKDLWKIQTEYIGAKPERWEKDKEGVPCLVELAYKGKMVKRYTPPISRSGKPYYAYSSLDTSETTTMQEYTPVNPKHTLINDNHIEKNDNIKYCKKEIKNPIHELCEKSKKIEIELECNVTLSIPPISLYGVIAESFENGADEFLQYVIDNIDTEEFKRNLSDSIYKLYTIKNNKE